LKYQLHLLKQQLMNKRIFT